MICDGSFSEMPHWGASNEYPEHTCIFLLRSKKNINNFWWKKAFYLELWQKNTQKNYNQGPVVQSIVSLMSLLVVKMLTVLVSTVSNSQVFLLKKCE